VCWCVPKAYPTVWGQRSQPSDSAEQFFNEKLLAFWHIWAYIPALNHTLTIAEKDKK